MLFSINKNLLFLNKFVFYLDCPLDYGLHQIPKIAPAVSPKIDSGNIKEVNRMIRVINRTGPQKPSFAMYVSTATMYGSRTK